MTNLRTQIRQRPLFGPNVAVSQIREARMKPYDFIAVGQDDAAHLAIEASAIRRGDDYNAKAVACMLECAARAVGRANRHARFCQRQLELAHKPKKVRRK